MGILKFPKNKKGRASGGVSTLSMFDDHSPVERFEGALKDSIRESMKSKKFVSSSQLPDTGWVRPSTFPSLRDSLAVSIDTETEDPFLHTKGPGFIRGDAHVIGVAIAAKSRSGERFHGYYPIDHVGGANFDKDKIASWLGVELDSDAPKIFANGPYDLEGLLLDMGVRVTGKIRDVQNAEGILDEESALVTKESHRGFALEKLGWKYCNRGKDEIALRRLSEHLKMKSQSEIKRNLKNIAPQAGPGDYAEEDAVLTLDVWGAQEPLIAKQDLTAIWELECDLVPMLMDMRIHGVAVDVERAHLVSKELQAEKSGMLSQLAREAGRAIDPWDPADLVKLCDAIKVEYLRTEKGNPSFTAPWLKNQEHPLLKMVLAIRKINKMDRDFVQAVIIGQSVNGRLHTQFHQLRRAAESSEQDGEEEGARSGRFSSTNPNLQQIPKRDKRFGPLIRSLFVPDPGKAWARGDYSGQEFRLLAHYAARCAKAGLLSPVAAEAAIDLMNEYNFNPNLDYHGKIAKMTQLDRDSVAKPLNLMLVYGAGKRKVAVSTGWITQAQFRDMEFKLPPEIEAFFDKYHAGVPFVKELLKYADKMALARGYVATILNRRRHFELYVPKNRDDGYGDALPLEVARQHWGDVPLVRADTRKALNSIIQGSGADMTKKAMLDIYRAGFLPALTVHDELDASIDGPKDLKLIHECMRDAVKTLVPIVAEMCVGSTWADADSELGKEKAKIWLAA